MTYCVALLLDEGLVLTSDTRTNAGVDQVAIYAGPNYVRAHDEHSCRAGLSSGCKPRRQMRKVGMLEFRSRIRESQPVFEL